MKKKQQLAGEMVVFASLTLLLIASLLFAFLEGARYHCLKSQAQMDSQLQMESAFAEYQKKMLEEYGLFLLDASYGSGELNTEKVIQRMLQLSEENTNPDTSETGGLDFLRIKLLDCDLDAFELASDQDGYALKRQMLAYAKDHMLVNIGEVLYKKLEEGDRLEKNGTFSEDQISQAKESITQGEAEQAERRQKAEQKKQEEGAEAEPYVDSRTEIEFENPIELFLSLKQKGILTLCVPEAEHLSQKMMDGELPSYEEENHGNLKVEKTESVTEKEAYLLYLKQKFGSYGNVLKNKKLDYELEYLIAGKSSDKENLEAIIQRLLWMREVANDAYLHTDLEKMNLARTMATSFSGVLANPALILPIQEGIVAAWAFIESVQDIRTLLSGGRIPLIKTAADWQTDPLHAASSVKESFGSKSTERGFSYQEYLLQFLLFTNDAKCTKRVLHLMEENIRLYPDCENFRMDCMIQRMKVNFHYESYPLFSKFLTIGNWSLDHYKFEETRELSYVLEE